MFDYKDIDRSGSETDNDDYDRMVTILKVMIVTMFKERPPLLDHLECRTQALCAALNLCQRQWKVTEGFLL